MADNRSRADSADRGQRALTDANGAFAQLPDEYLNNVAERAIAEARQQLRMAPFVTVNVVKVTVTQNICLTDSAPYLTATLSSTPS